MATTKHQILRFHKIPSVHPDLVSLVGAPRRQLSSQLSSNLLLFSLSPLQNLISYKITLHKQNLENFMHIIQPITETKLSPRTTRVRILKKLQNEHGFMSFLGTDQGIRALLEGEPTPQSQVRVEPTPASPEFSELFALAACKNPHLVEICERIPLAEDIVCPTEYQPQLVRAGSFLSFYYYVSLFS